jgi:hypothetical protein
VERSAMQAGLKDSPALAVVVPACADLVLLPCSRDPKLGLNLRGSGRD